VGVTAGIICARHLQPPSFRVLNTRRAVFLQIGAVILALALLLLLSRFLAIANLIDRLQKAVMHWGTWSILGYPFLFALCNALLMPGGVLSVGAGFFFGVWRGFLLVLIGNTIAAATSFALSRWVGRRWFRRKFEQSRILQLLRPAAEREGWKVVALSQLHPMFPTSLLNYLFGLTNIRFATCMVWTTVGRAPGLFLYIYLGTLGKAGYELARGTHHPAIREYWVWVTAFAMAVLLVFVLTHMAVRSMRTTGEDAETLNRADSRQLINA
jgi:uncharacterized membrane protein YdjX (TVP38/TMEM64 family)